MATLSYLTTTHFDFGAIRRLPRALALLGITRPLIATDRGVAAARIAEKVEAAMGRRGGLRRHAGKPDRGGGHGGGRPLS